MIKDEVHGFVEMSIHGDKLAGSAMQAEKSCLETPVETATCPGPVSHGGLVSP